MHITPIPYQSNGFSTGITETKHDGVFIDNFTNSPKDNAIGDSNHNTINEEDHIDMNRKIKLIGTAMDIVMDWKKMYSYLFLSGHGSFSAMQYFVISKALKHCANINLRTYRAIRTTHRLFIRQKCFAKARYVHVGC